MIFMISLLTCCKTHQSVIEKSTVIARDTTTISQVVDKDSTSQTAKIDSIIIEDYAADNQTEQTTGGHNNHGHKASQCQKRNDISQKAYIPPKRKIKIYGVNLSGSWLSTKDSLNKKMTHQATTKSEIKQKTPMQTTTGSKYVYAIIAFVITLFVGYVFWKNAVQ